MGEQFEQVEILLVEDNPRDAELTARALRSGGVVAGRLLWVRDGQEALDYLFRSGDYAGRADTIPRLILLDLKMPRVDGLGVLKAAKADARTRGIPIVVMTSSEEERDVAKTYEFGANSYVVKPVDFNALADFARRAGCYWLGVNRTPGH
jgi:CheY-like chemotaxis protein